MLSEILDRIRFIFFPKKIYIPTIPEPQKWTKDDGRAFLTFLKSPVGRRFLACLQAELGGLCHVAMSAAEDRDYKSGYSAGFRGSLIVIQGLSSTHMLADSMIDTPEADQDESPFGE